MSEYQYYEFQAIDRPLTKEQMAEIRAISTRATITPTRFVNEYTWGDFKGDPHAMIEKYYDAFLYVANWGTHRFMLRLPRQLLAMEAAAPYCRADGASAQEVAECAKGRGELPEARWNASTGLGSERDCFPRSQQLVEDLLPGGSRFM